MNRKINIAGVWIDNVSTEDTLRYIDGLIFQKKPVHIVTPNVDHIIQLQKDMEFKAAYESAALVVPDGMPLLWAGYFLGTPLKERVCGSDLVPLLCEKGHRVFFLGAAAGVAAKAAEILKRKMFLCHIVGVYSPPPGFESNAGENQRIIRMIQEAKPDILFVGVGAPKQEKWIAKHKDLYNVPVSIGVGGAFDFIAGVMKRAPVWIRNSGFEWFWRLLQEPGRLWKRYLVEDIKFPLLVFKQKLKRRPA